MWVEVECIFLLGDTAVPPSTTQNNLIEWWMETAVVYNGQTKQQKQRGRILTSAH